MIPHITDEIKSSVRRLTPNYDVVITEIGGTVGDIEGLPFLEAIRQLRNDVGRENTLFIHLTLIPYMAAAGELKTKPTQHSVRELMEIGIMPDILICRTEQELTEDLRRKIALFCNVKSEAVIEARDVETIYEVPLVFHAQNLDGLVVDKLGLDVPEPELSAWRAMVERVKRPSQGSVRIAVVGKYTNLVDSYKSIQQALIHGGIANDVRVHLDWVSSEEFNGPEDANRLADYHGLLVPGGFGVRGVEGMVRVVQWARENELPFFGICLGLQSAIIEFARNVCNLEGSHSREFAPECEDPVVSLMDAQRKVTEMGGTMRLGAYPCQLAPDSLAARIYGVLEISERHRHRYEVNNEYRGVLADHGLRMSGLSPDGMLVEIIEMPSHPWYVATQFHPELKSRPAHPHPLFASFIEAAVRHRDGRRAGELKAVRVGE